MKEQRIGTLATLQTSWGFTIIVEILDFKQSYGRNRWLVKPVSGQGEAWVENV